jgi:hypothetical protein
MHGKERKDITYYACSYRISYGDKAAEALGHGRWRYVREDALLPIIDGFFEQRVFGEQRIARFLEQRATLAGELRRKARQERARLERRLTDVDQRVELQLHAIEAGVDPTLVHDRVETLMAALAAFDDAGRTDAAIDLDDVCEILESLPNLTEALAAARA